MDKLPDEFSAVYKGFYHLDFKRGSDGFFRNQWGHFTYTEKELLDDFNKGNYQFVTSTPNSVQEPCHEYQPGMTF